MWKPDILTISVAVGFAMHHVHAPAKTHRQSFFVVVPTRASVQAPRWDVSAQLPPGIEKIRLPEQNWNVASNSQSGATFRLQADHKFLNRSGPKVERDARLELRVAAQSHAGNWIATRPMATTSDTDIGPAFVEAKSSQPGSAQLGLTVTCEPDGSVSTAAGSYELTITGTITAN